LAFIVRALSRRHAEVQWRARRRAGAALAAVRKGVEKKNDHFLLFLAFF